MVGQLAKKITAVTSITRLTRRLTTAYLIAYNLIKVSGALILHSTFQYSESNSSKISQHKIFLDLNLTFSFRFLIECSNTTSINSIATDATSSINHVPDSLDTKIETLLRDWHHNPDLLFSIHPIDGSFLIWHIEWLDEYHPGSFRQAQISFSTRIPNAFPLGDASTMSHNVSMYSHNTGGPLLNIRESTKSANKSVEGI